MADEGMIEGEPEPGAVPQLPPLTLKLLDSMTEGVSLSTAAGIMVYTNPAEDRLFGYQAGELTGRHVAVQNAYPPAENERIVADVIAQLQRSGAWEGEWLNRRKDGSSFVSATRISAVEIDGALYWLCVRDDITDAKRAAEALRESQQRLELAAQAAELGIWDWDLATNRMTYSLRARAICGFPAEGEISYEDVRAITHPEDLPHTSELAQRALDPALRERPSFKYRLLLADGTVRWVIAHGEAVFDGEGEDAKALRYVGTLQDITAQVEAEAALRASEARLRLAQKAAHFGVWDWDLGSNAIMWSREMYEILGLEEAGDGADPYAGWLRVLHPDDRDFAEAAARGAAEQGRDFAIDFRVLLADGEQRWVRSHGVAVNDAAGRPQRVVGVNIDVTDERRREEELRALAGSLQNAVDEGERERDRIYQLSDDLFAVAGFDGYLKSINPAWERLLGRPVAELLERPFAELIHPDDHEDAARVLGQMQQGESIQRFEDRLLRADGSAVLVA